MTRPTRFRLLLADGEVFTLRLQPDGRHHYRFVLDGPDGTEWNDPIGHAWSYCGAIGAAMAYVGASLGNYVARCEPIAERLRLVR